MKRLMMICGLVIIFESCYNDKYNQLYGVSATACDTSVVSYKNDILPILISNCTSNSSGGCHVPGGAGTFDFTIYTGVQPFAVNGDLLGDINWETGHYPMPQTGPKLPGCYINKITKWVHDNAPDN